MQLRLNHTLDFMSLVAVYVPTEMCRADEKEIFYAKLNFSASDFNAVTGTERTGYELCVGLHGSGTRNTNSLLLNFEKFRRLKIAGSWYQRLELPRWTWYSTVGGIAKETDHIFVSTRWRILQKYSFPNCRVLCN